MEELLISVIILSYNGSNDLIKCLNSLNNLNYKNTELILVDNNSQDNSVEIVKNNYKNVKIVELKKNFGFALGNNIGVACANGDYIVLLNQDTVVDKNWLTELVKVAKSSEKIGIVGSKIYYYDKRNIIDFAGSSCDKYGNTRQIGAEKRDNKVLNIKRKSFYICGASLLFKREVYENIKLFDPFYFMYYEDVDFCWRAWISGYDVIYTPKSFIYHKINNSSQSFERNKYFSEKNCIRTLLKNYEIKSIIRILPNYIFLRLHSIYRYRKHKGHLSHKLFIIYLKSISWNLLHIRSLINFRKNIQKNRKRNDKFIFKLMEELENFAKNLN